MDYPLENLDPERFQQFCQSLLVKGFPVDAERSGMDQRSSARTCVPRRRLQSDGAPLLGPEHRKVGQALDAEPARKPSRIRIDTS